MHREIPLKNRFFVSTSKIAAGIGSLALISMLAGCGIGNVATTTSPVEGVTLGGMVHGGEQGVTGSTIQLYAVGTGGYGSNATPLGTPAVTDQYGSWSINRGSYTCPSGTPQVYITATGGNPGLATGTNNTAIKMAAALGSCSALTQNTNIDINEVTTVAAAFALGQFFNFTGDSFGAANTAQSLTGITNAMSTASRLADYTTGTAITAQTLTSTNAAITTTITTAPESAKLYTLANILSSCINTTGPTSTACMTLFGNTAPFGATAPVNTLEAAVYLSLNPTSNSNATTTASNSTANITNLYMLQTPVTPFIGVQTQPTDWTLGILYTGTPTGTQTPQSQTLLHGANDVAIDSNGNVWLINYDTANPTTESLTELSPTGVPLQNVFNSGATAPASMAGTGPRNLAIDTSNNVFVATSTLSYIFGYNTTTSTTSYLADSSGAYDVAAYGTDVYLQHSSGTTGTSIGIDVFANGVLAAANRYEFSYNATPVNEGQYLGISTAGTLYISPGTGTSITSATGTSSAAAIAGGCTAGAQCLATTYSPTYTAITATLNAPYQPAAGVNGAMWIPNASATGGVSYIASAGATPVNFENSPASTAAFNTARRVVVDGVGNAFVLNRGSSDVSEVTSAGAILSPYPTTGNTTPIGFTHGGMSSVTGMGIDPSGNIWVSNGVNPTASPLATDTNSIFEIVGLAAPTITPIATNVTNNKVGTRP